jgi:hypothetical protein
MNTNEALSRIDELNKIRTALRAKERNLQSRAKVLSGVPLVNSNQGDIQQLENSFRKFLPESHVPGNVGGLNRVAWKFYFQTNFDLGTGAVIDKNTLQTREFQVSQESAFIMLSVSRASSDQDSENTPLLLQFRDRQSSRVQMDKPIAFQTIGKVSRPTILTTPFLLMPNAKFETSLQGFTTFDAGKPAAKNQHQISFFGYRIRVEDADKVLTAVFGQL